MLRNLLNPRRLRVGCFDFDDEELGSDRPRLRRLLGAIVYQAMHDGMMKVRIGVNRASGEPFMKYFGPIDYDPEKQIWWDMEPPPPECYPVMLQVCLSVAELEPRLPIKGVIPATKDRRRLNLQLAVEEVDSFEIAWNDEYALDRSGERTVIDLPGSEGEDTDDSIQDGADNKDVDNP